MAWVCLMYHDVLPATASRGGAAERFAVTAGAFERMLDVIRAEGYRGCSVAAALAAPGGRRVAISFDDGTASQHAHAFPALRARGMTATFYVTTDWIGQPGFMTWDQLREMAAAGMSIQSHTRTHPFLSELDATRLRDELSGSKAALDRELGQDTSELSLPGGNGPRPSLRPLLREVGFRVIAGSRWGRNPDVQAGRRVRRCTVRGDLTAATARRVLAGDHLLTLARAPREMLLNGIRAALGASRYARWRRGFLDRVDGA